jgi:hypothetical protein
MMGIAGLMTTNSGALLEICWIEILRELPFVTTTVAAWLVVFVVTDPKLSEVGLTPTPPAQTTAGKTTEPTKSKRRHKYASRTLFMREQSSSSI